MRVLSDESLRWVVGGDLPASGWYDGEIAVDSGVVYSWSESQHQWESIADNPEEAADYYNIDVDHSQGADIDGVTDNMLSIFDEIAAAWDAYTGIDPTITSGTDGDHNPGTIHPMGNALDLRTTAAGLNSTQISGIASTLQSSVGGDYDVVIEGNHIHVEYDPD